MVSHQYIHNNGLHTRNGPYSILLSILPEILHGTRVVLEDWNVCRLGPNQQ